MAMLGRALFVVVCLTIAAGVALPLYPSDVGWPTIAAADGSLLLASAPAKSCEDCEPSAGGSVACPVGHALRSPATPPTTCFNLTVYLVVRPALPGTRTSELGLLPLRLPAI